MMGRKWYAVGLVLVICGMACGVAGYVLPRRSAINKENVAKIQKGTTLAEVEAILGGPARDESHGRTVPSFMRRRNFLLITPRARMDWVSNETAVSVDFWDDCVGIFTLGFMREIDESITDRVRRWFGL